MSTAAVSGQRRIDAFAPYVATAAAALVYSLLALRRVWELKAGAFDAGLLDNVIYKVSIGLGNVTGLTGEAHYAARPLVFVLGLPLYWVNSDLGYSGLLVMQAVSVAMIGLAAWLIADAIGLSRGRKYAALLFVLASPAAYWAVITELHVTGLSMGLVALTIAGAYRRWSLTYYWILPVLASMARIEIALTVIVVGILLWRVSRVHAVAAIVSGGVVAVVLVGLTLVVTARGSSLGVHLNYLGVDSFTQLPMGVLRNPGTVIRELLDPMFLFSALMWLVTIGVVLPLRASRWFIIAIPTLLVAAIGSPAFADVWFTHYWNYLLVAAGIAFVLSLSVWAFTDRVAVWLVVIVLVVAWVLPGTWFVGTRYPVIYPSASSDDQQTAVVAASVSGALSATSRMVLPGGHREWVYMFPNPFVCLTDQYAYFSLEGPVPDVIITDRGWEEDVEEADVARLRRILAEDYEVVDTFGTHTVRRIVPGATPPRVAECQVLNLG